MRPFLEHVLGLWKNITGGFSARYIGVVIIYLQFVYATLGTCEILTLTQEFSGCWAAVGQLLVTTSDRSDVSTSFGAVRRERRRSRPRHGELRPEGFGSAELLSGFWRMWKSVGCLMVFVCEFCNVFV